MDNDRCNSMGSEDHGWPSFFANAVRFPRECPRNLPPTGEVRFSFLARFFPLSKLCPLPILTEIPEQFFENLVPLEYLANLPYYNFT